MSVCLVLEEEKNIVSATLVIFSILFTDTSVRSSSVCEGSCFKALPSLSALNLTPALYKCTANSIDHNYIF